MVRIPSQATESVGPVKKIHSHTLRILHKWIGLIIGIQVLLWTLSGAVMSLLPMDDVAGGEVRKPPGVQLTPTIDAWPTIREQLGEGPVTGASLRLLLDRPILEVGMDERVRLFDAATGRPVPVTAQLARQIASTAYVGKARVRNVRALRELTLPVREHQLPIWQVDFADDQNSSFYVSGSTGALLERRNDTWRVWDFFWMLHIMDYAKRSSFNHPVIWLFGFAAVWLAITGFWLIFRTGWRSDFKHRSWRKGAHPKPPFLTHS